MQTDIEPEMLDPKTTTTLNPLMNLVLLGKRPCFEGPKTAPKIGEHSQAVFPKHGDFFGVPMSLP